ncbi:MAG TPA: putative toxin-antitoxin system toxin component, PIN family [Pyrinomonadaceae bacterium]|nr:putative toxin-antitoxin system toxin component, PIN family [Pyrinomonadaceae bacterium]
MPPRKKRIAVVLDTNVLIAFYLSKSPKSVSIKIVWLWRHLRKLQLIVSDETVAEYLEIFARLNIPPKQIKSFVERIEKRQTVTKFSLGKIPTESRDVDDNLMLATALVGKADFLITNDKDLLDITETDKKKFKFRIVTPIEFLNVIGE